MFKKTVAALALTLILALGATTSFAQFPDASQIPAEMLAELKKEPPLAQADIDAYLKLMPQLVKGVANEEAFNKLLADAGLSQARFTMATSKISLAQAMAMGVTLDQINAAQLPDEMKPTDADVELVKKNKEKLDAMTMQMQMPAAQ